MSDAADSHAQHEAHEVHEGPIKTPKQLIGAVIASFVVPVVLIILLANFVNLGGKEGAGSDGMSEEAVAARLQPVGSIELKVAGDTSALKTGEQVFQAQCSACHSTGAAGAPKLGDKDAWGPRIAQGYEALLTAALKGKGNMGPQGGGDFSDLEIGRAVVHMANAAGGSLEEPKAPAAAASAAPAASAASQ